MKKVCSIVEDSSQTRIKVILYGTFNDTVKRKCIVLIHNENTEKRSTNKVLGTLRKSVEKNELLNSSRYRPDIIREKRKARQKKVAPKKKHKFLHH
jgi:hypothetical protein